MTDQERILELEVKIEVLVDMYAKLLQKCSGNDRQDFSLTSIRDTFYNDVSTLKNKKQPYQH